jgi:hypothetical protein
MALPISATAWSGLLLLALTAHCGERSSQAKPSVVSNDTEPAHVAVAPPSPTGPTKPLAEWITWRVADTGFGSITIGMTPEQANAAVGGALELPRDMTHDACDYTRARGIDSLAFMIEMGKIVRVDVQRHDIQTAAGARVGDTEARIQQLYPGRVRVLPHKYTDGHYLTVVPADTSAHRYRLIFETDGRVVTRFRGGALPQVEYVEGCS